MKKINKTITLLFLTFCFLLSVTSLISFSSNMITNDILIKSIKPLYDEASGIIVNEENVIFNDKNQVVNYNVVIENTKNYDIQITDMKLSTPTEEFLQFEVKNISNNKVIEANTTKEVTISFETKGIEGWGRNFKDALVANLYFDKATSPEKDKIDKPSSELPSNIEDIFNTSELEISNITNNTIEFKDDFKVNTEEKVAVWLYNNTKFLGYFDIEVTNGTTKIVGLDSVLKKVDSGEHNIVILTESNETLGYISVYVNEQKEILKDTLQDNTNKEENTTTKPNKDSNKENKEENVDNPYTSDKNLLTILIISSGVACLGIIIVSKNKLTKYTLLIIMLSSTLTLVNAEDTIKVSLNFNVSFKSQNVMKPSYTKDATDKRVHHDYWLYRKQIKNIYIRNSVQEITDCAYKFDVTQDKNSRVMSYLVKNKDNSNYYDLYLQADGIIYLNEDASFYFFEMTELSSIDNIEGLDTSEVKNMFGMFGMIGYNSKSLELDLSSFNTSSVTDMATMFTYACYSCSNFDLNISTFDTSQVTDMFSIFNSAGTKDPNFNIDVSNFDTSNVTDMSYMFAYTGNNSTKITLDVSGFNTSKVTNMCAMFSNTGVLKPDFTLDVSNFDTSNVTDMSYMFNKTGQNSTILELDISNFDTSKVTNMEAMFQLAGYTNPDFVLDVSSFDTSNVTNMSYMFAYAGYSNPSFTLNVSNFDMNKVTNVEGMFSATGYNSSKLIIDLTINNTCINSYKHMLSGIAVTSGSKVRINYTKAADNLVDNLISTKVESANVSKGYLIVDVDNLSVGDEIHIAGERFNVITQTDNTITMLAQYNLKPHFRQSTWANIVLFSDSNGWNYKPAPQEIDIQVWSTYVSELVNGYVDFLKTELEDNSITGDLITLKQLELLGCTVPPDYATGAGGWTCADSNYKSWLINDQSWWTRSAHSTNSEYLWAVKTTGELGAARHSKLPRGVRPTLTISKEVLKNNIEKYTKKES